MEKPIEWKPNEQSLNEFKRGFKFTEVVDVYGELLKELFFVRNPVYRIDKNYSKPLKKFIDSHTEGKSLDKIGNWFLFPWNEKLVHYLPDELHQEVRTARNKNVITKDEQQKLYDFTVGIAGLSVGSHAALTISLMGMCRHIKLADPDTVSASNLNRIRYDFTVVGKSKVTIVKELIYQMNPYAVVEEFPEGITTDNINDFLIGSKKIGLLIEEMDNLEMKIRIRLEARKKKIPVVMATDNGDNVILDIERFDSDPDLELFNGVVGKLSLDEFRRFQPHEMPKLATKIAGPNLVIPRMLASLLEVGKTLYSWPQLGDAATLAGVSIAYVTKRIALKQKIKAGKSEINLDSILDPEYNDPIFVAERDKARKASLKIIGLFN